MPPECQLSGNRTYTPIAGNAPTGVVGSGAVPAGSRLTITTIDADPRAAAIAAAAAANHLRPPRAASCVSDLVFVEGDLDDAERDRARRVPRRPAAADRRRGTSAATATAPSRSRSTPASPTAPPTPSSTPPPSSACRSRAAATGRRIEFPPGRRRRRRRPAAPARRQPGHRALDRRRRRARRSTPASTTPPAVEIDRRPRPRRRRRSAALGAERSLALDPAELRRHPRPLRGRRAATRPTSSSRRSPRRGASTAPTRRSGPRITTDDGDRRCRRCSTSCATATDADRRAVRALGVRRQRRDRRRSPPGTTLALKAETHNHPSAVEPFGGANTGVGGVIRDVLGAAHRPIAVTDVLCFGPPDLAARRRSPTARCTRCASARASIDGVADYGNKIGLPTVAGAVLYDPGYTTNPLVFCGCIGVAADRPLHDRPVPRRPRRRARRRAPGATASAGRRSRQRTMDATTGEVAGASVQIGDPVTEKLLIDVLDGAERPVHGDHRLRRRRPVVGGRRDGRGRRRRRRARRSCRSSTRASSRGRSGCPRPRSGWSSPSPPDRLAELRRALRPPRRRARRPRRVHRRRPPRRAPRRRGRARPRHRVPPRRPAAAADDRRRCRRPTATPRRPRTSTTRRRRCCALLAHPQHRLQGGDRSTATTTRSAARTVVRPLVGVAGDGPADGVVLADPATTHGIADRHRRQPVVRPARPRGDGRTPSSTRRSATSSPSAPTPTGSRCSTTSRGATRGGRRRSASWSPPSTAAATPPIAYGAPFVSGKDSLNNEYTGADGQRHAVPPTLVITAVAHVPDAGRCVTAELDGARQRRSLLLGAHRAGVRRQPPRPRARRRRPTLGAAPAARPRRARRATAGCTGRSAPGSCGRATTSARAASPSPLAEMCIAGRLGATVDALPARRSRHRAVRRVGRPPRRRGRAARRRPLRRRSLGDAARARRASPTTPMLVVAGRRRARRRRARRRVHRIGPDAAHEPVRRARHRRAGHEPRPRRRRSRSTSPAPSRRSCSPASCRRPDAARPTPASSSSPAGSATATRSAPGACWPSTSRRVGARRARCARSSPPAAR